MEGPWPAPPATGPVLATVTVPGSKSQTNRALILAALGTTTEGTAGVVSKVSGALRSRDTNLMIAALQTLGVRIDGDGTELTVSGAIAPAADVRIDCGLAGTVLRFVPPLAALGARQVLFDGDEQARARPITPLLDAMRGLGVGIDGSGMPFTVSGTGSVAGGEVHIDASSSSQFVSGLLLSGATFRTGLTVVHTGESVPSAPHIAMTVAMLRDAGVAVDDSQRQPVDGFTRADFRTAVGHRAGPVQRGAVPGRGGGHRRTGAAGTVAAAQRAAAEHHPGPVGTSELHCPA